MAFMEDEVISYALKMLTKKPRAKQQGALIAETHLALRELDGQREELARELLGPRGGMPRNKAELVKLAVLCNVEIKETDTNDQIREKVKPTVELIINKKKMSSLAAAKSMNCSTPGSIQEGPGATPAPMSPPPSTRLRRDQGHQEGPDQVPWGMTLDESGHVMFPPEQQFEGKDWVMTPVFFQMNDENDPHL